MSSGSCSQMTLLCKSAIQRFWTVTSHKRLFISILATVPWQKRGSKVSCLSNVLIQVKWCLTDSAVVMVTFLGVMRLTQRNASCLACLYCVMDVHGKFGERERTVRVARGVSREQLWLFTSWLLSKLPKCIHNSIYEQLQGWTNFFIKWRQQLGHVLLVIDFKVLTIHGEGNQRSLGS